MSLFDRSGPSTFAESTRLWDLEAGAEDGCRRGTTRIWATLVLGVAILTTAPIPARAQCNQAPRLQLSTNGSCALGTPCELAVTLESGESDVSAVTFRLTSNVMECSACAPGSGALNGFCTFDAETCGVFQTDLSSPIDAFADGQVVIVTAACTQVGTHPVVFEALSMGDPIGTPVPAVCGAASEIVCVGCDPAGCTDGNDCTNDVCTEGGCTNAPLDAGTPCLDDGDPLTDDQCDGTGVCTHPLLGGWSISGRTRRANGTPIPGVTVQCDNDGGTTRTNGLGEYWIEVPFGWTGNCMPTLATFTFRPEKYVYAEPLVTNRPAQGYTGQKESVRIQGRTRFGSGIPVEGVVINCNNMGGTAITREDGSYDVSVPAGWTGTCTPHKSGFQFRPATYSYTTVEQNFPAQGYTVEKARFFISGRTRLANGAPLPDTTVFCVGEGSRLTNAEGEYGISVPFEWTGVCTPHRSGFNFRPPFYEFESVRENRPGRGFTADPVPTTKAITGRIRLADLTPVADIAVGCDNDGGVSVSDELGAYRVDVPFGWSGTCQPESAAFSFRPASYSYTDLRFNKPAQGFIATPADTGP